MQIFTSKKIGLMSQKILLLLSSDKLNGMQQQSNAKYTQVRRSKLHMLQWALMKIHKTILLV